MDKLRWHLPLNRTQYQKSILTYMEIYMNKIRFGQISLMEYCRNNDFDFTKFIDAGFRNLMTNYLELPHMLDLIMIFLSEG